MDPIHEAAVSSEYLYVHTVGKAIKSTPTFHRRIAHAHPLAKENHPNRTLT